ncbi:MAG: 2,3,4,5-tetrahydropyridine-2,6-dicarboxylate N-succinyltransferase [Candidatus Kapabacteria bacterium]|nr:2,3,4,5-tetrahydropyridine-2,6-dicarboxylate N-succinyltransferase [Candidatus Kapabacteria bacterium]
MDFERLLQMINELDDEDRSIKNWIELALVRLEKEEPTEDEKKEFASKVIFALNTGIIRAAEQTNDGNWVVNSWVKQAILNLFKYSKLTDMSAGGFSFYDKEALAIRRFSLGDQVRVVPGGSAIRAGAYVAPGVICMPPMYINIGAYVDEGTMVDSHALVGTCAQIGRNVHISAASQIGGVLEPAGASPVIIEDNVIVGGNCGVYEGVIVRKNAVLATGVILNASTKVYDVVNGTIIESKDGKSTEIPAGAVVVPGSRRVKGEFAAEHGLAISTPLIIKYRDEHTNAKTALEEALR